jgi:HD-GYP domain-containing protein (c-di-GMP phosphodiesterase class II)
MIKDHSRAGYEIVAAIAFPQPVAEMVLQHHERCDGSGYPRGLQGEDILLGARVIGVADTVEAMSSHRPYRPALGLDAALDEIRRGRGTLFDPLVVDTCLEIVRDGRLVPGPGALWAKR